MKQTAVEWLVEQLIPEDQHEGIIDIIEQAKEMEKEQSITTTKHTEVKMNKETLEEAAERFSIDIREENYKDGFIEGAKWQQERMYSEAIEFAEWIRIKDFQTASKDNWIGLDMKYYTTEELFEQFKKEDK